MFIYISGGCKNGKSMLAQTLAKKLADGGPMYYIATMIPRDSEDDLRIARHIADRDGWGFETIEQGTNLLKCLEKGSPDGTYLLDSVTAIMSNEMFSSQGVDHDAPQRVFKDLTEFARKVKNVVMVSDFIFGDAERYDEFTEEYRRGLAKADRAALYADTVVEVCGGNYIVHKGELPL